MSVLRHIPNALTIIRCLLTVPMAFYLWQKSYNVALVLFVVAGVSDGLDGYLAKRFSWQSRFGAIADPLADKLLLITGFFTLSMIQVLPWWLAVLVIGRDLVIVLGAYVYHRLFGPYDMQPSLLSKFNTLAQIVFLSLILLHLAQAFPLTQSVLVALIVLVSLTTTLSGLHYVWLWGRRTNELMTKRNAG